MRAAALALALAAVWPYHLAAQRDTTVCTAFRTRTAGNGAILSTSVAKVACGAVARVDTLIWQSNLNAARDSLVFTGPFRYSSISGLVVPPGFPLPPGPVTVAERDTVYFSPQTNAARDSVLWFGPLPWRAGVKPTDFKLPLGPGRVDTVYRAPPVPPPVVTPPVTPPVVTPPAGSARPPELPRGTVDTTMPVAPAPGGVIIRVPEGSS